MRRLVPALLVLFLAATPAGAVSCAPSEVTADQLVAAGLDLDRYHYDLAVVGQVVSITTDESEGQAYGRTYVEIGVVGAYGSTQSPRGLVVTTPDPGWNSGHAFQEGKFYFVPVVASGPSGMTNYVAACDLVEEVPDPDATAARLATVAAENGVAYTFPVVAGGSAALVTVIFLALMIGLFLWTGRRLRANRREVSGTDSDRRPPPEPRR